MRPSVILSAVRTPTGKFLGTLKDLNAHELGAMTLNKVCGSGLKAVMLAAQVSPPATSTPPSPAAWSR
jgi:acetyl-CoA acetyltransferase